MFRSDLSRLVNAIRRGLNDNNSVAGLQFLDMSCKDTILHVAKEESVHSFEQRYAFLTVQVFRLGKPGSLETCSESFEVCWRFNNAKQFPGGRPKGLAFVLRFL
jgi:hypothetical protein